MVEIKLFTNKNAKKHIQKIIENSTHLEDEFYNDYVKRWLNESRDVKCYTVFEKGNISNIILLSKMDYDPQRKHKTPYMLDFIYTFIAYRRNNFAYKISIF